MTRVILAFIFFLFAAAFFPLATALDMDKLRTHIVTRFGPNAVNAFQSWEKLLGDGKSLQTAEKLKRVNEFFNRRTRFTDDLQTWGNSDYWATPMETLGKGAGDCEDFTIAKYFTLLNLGIPNEKLRLIYVKARLGGSDSKLTQAHMVLAYYPDADSEPLVLDNLITDIRPASRRPDLTPVFSFNNKEIWQGASGNATPGSAGSGSLSRWQELLQRVRDEGFEQQ